MVKTKVSEKLPLRITLAQINSRVGDFSGNLDKVKYCIERSHEEKSELIVFPELCLSSYPPLDLIESPSFRNANAKALSLLLEWISLKKFNLKVVIGSMMPNDANSGRAVHNAAVGIHQGKVGHIQRKQLLPTYSVFDEARYFEAGPAVSAEQSQWQTKFNSEEFNLGFSVCEDAWYCDLHEGRILYMAHQDPALALKGSDLCVNTSASPFELFKQDKRGDLLGGFAKRTGSPLIYVNAVGVNDELVFDGDSRIVGSQGESLLRLPSFEEVLSIVTFDFKTETLREECLEEIKIPKASLGKSFTKKSLEFRNPDPVGTPKKAAAKFPAPLVGVTPLNEIHLQLLHDALVLGIRDYFHKTGFTKAVLGLSGGIDSAVVAALAARALGPENVTGISLPSKFSSSHSIADAQSLAKNLNIVHDSMPIKMVYTTALLELKRFSDVSTEAAMNLAQENLQARLRGLLLMGLSNQEGSLLLTTGNKSELAVGYCTIYGDMCGALAPLGDVYKTWVFELAHFINKDSEVIPHSTLVKPPSAELKEGQTDQDSLPPYELLDPMLQAQIEWRWGKEELREELLPHLKSLWEKSEVPAIRGQAHLQLTLKQGHAWFKNEERLLDTVLNLIYKSEFKRRQAAPVVKVTPRAFGMGRRMPVVKLNF